MGCCLGTTSRPPNPAPPPPNHLRRHSHHHQKLTSLTQTVPKTYEKSETRSPPRLLEPEEESVKEVLSETPIPKLLPASAEIIPPPDNTNVLVLSPKQPEIAEEEPKMQPEVAVSETSQLSEPCPAMSKSYSYSTTTTATTIADAREDEVTSNRKTDTKGSSRVRRRLPPPRRTPEQAGGKRNRTTEMTSAAFRGRESGQMRTMQRGNVGGGGGGGVPSGVRRETVSSRSRSPATRNVGGGGSRPGRGKSPAKAVAGRGGGGGSANSVGSVEESEKKKNSSSISGSSSYGQEAKEEALEARKAEEDRTNEDGGVSRPQQEEVGKESLDNPMVSLECFIFV